MISPDGAEPLQTQNRPLYIRIRTRTARKAAGARSSARRRGDGEIVPRFLRGGTGSDQGTGSGLSGNSFVLAIFGGPVHPGDAVHPIDDSLSPSISSPSRRRRQVGAAARTFYALGIIGSFTGVGVLITGVFTPTSPPSPAIRSPS